ncbi:4Fe-4S dicluster domain-containing protein [Glycomyces harbinensis]|uniref:4Fe-4S dicluster containing protein n=1 Tax=Glycomyces harbinensis TaxID=58114 RepID=A0A1G6XM87_9ACTN|nr:4Fe-4S dicluster domain-containing protein [Glycomyces harbinensis]SDD79290.1 4Fe-4S dicluster containing protein [Glycomyces harbinensis]
MLFDHPPPEVIDRAGLDQLVKLLRADGYTVIGPTVRGDAIVLAELANGADLPDGIGVDTDAGRYRLRRRGDRAVFNHSAGPQSWKQFVHPPRQRLDGPETVHRYAFLGTRPCDLAALAVLDGVLGAAPHPDERYLARRDEIFVVAVNCVEPGSTCFCASMGIGPKADRGYDLVLTERTGHEHRFLISAGSVAGEEMMDRLSHRRASGGEIAAGLQALDDAADSMGRTMPEVDLRGLLVRARRSDHWEEVANRCLACANCTMVCPTCFCTTVEDTTDLEGDHAERWQRWGSCFDPDFSFVHGGPVRETVGSRYRQWMSHKLSTWYDQFGTSGCVGCGRCIAWCPAGIDLTAEAAALAEKEEAP